MRASWAILFLLFGCSRCAGPPPLAPGVYRFTPKAEDDEVGPVGTGSARCGLYVYAWANDGHCKLQLNHCSLASPTSSDVVCMSLADERTIPCGGTDTACGQTIECVCPPGATAAPVPLAAGTVHLTNAGAGPRISHGACDAHPTTIPGGPPPAPCIVAIHECDLLGGCNDRELMFSCGARDTVCDTPVVCDCPP